MPVKLVISEVGGKPSSSCLSKAGLVDSLIADATESKTSSFSPLACPITSIPVGD